MSEPAARLDVLHVTPRLGREGGGVWQFVVDLALAQAEAGRAVAIVGLKGDALDEDVPAGVRVTDEVDPHADRGVVQLEAATPTPHPIRALGYSRDLARRVNRLASQSRLIHLHGGLRMWTPSPVRRAAERHNVPVLFAPHGGLYPWMLARNRLKKRLLYGLLDRRNLAAIDMLHATCEQELGYCREYGLRQPACVVPPGVRPLPAGEPELFLAEHPHLRHKRLCGFLGYFDRKKGLVRLARAWSQVAATDWHLVIAGHDQGGHAAEVEAEIARLNVGGRVSVIGPQMGRAKSDYLASLDLFALPTDWENFGVVLGEALSLGVPVITTTNTPWQWVAAAGVGWFIEPTEAALTGALREATARPRVRVDRATVVERLQWSRAVAALDEATRPIRKA